MKKIHDKNKILSIILQNSAKLSDREVAKLTKVSQPTITRFRHYLKEKGIVKNYQVIPDFDQIGYPIFAILQIEPSDILKTQEYLNQREEILFQANTSAYAITLSVHKTYRKYVKFLNEIRRRADVEEITLGLTENITKTFKIGDLDINLANPLLSY